MSRTEKKKKKSPEVNPTNLFSSELKSGNEEKQSFVGSAAGLSNMF